MAEKQSQTPPSQPLLAQALEKIERREAAPQKDSLAQRLDDIPEINLEDINKARKLLVTALAWVDKNVYGDIKEKYKLGTYPPDWYLPIMIKESRLKQSAPGGYFQLGKTALQEIENKMKVHVDPEHPFHDVIGGILYFHMCRFDFAEHKTFRGASERDKELLAYAVYNAGASTVQRLWAAFKPRNFEDFAKKLSKHMTGVDSQFTRVDAAYKVSYPEVAVITRYLKNQIKNPKQTIGVRGVKLRKEKIPIFLRYTFIIDGLRKKMGTSIKTPEKSIRSLVARREKYDPETNSVWQMAKKLSREMYLQRSARAPFLNDFFNGNDAEDADSIDVFVDAIVELNQKNNPQLSRLDDSVSNVPQGEMFFYIPSLAFLEDFAETRNERERQFDDVKERVLPSRREVETAVGDFYMDKTAEAEGGKILSTKGQPKVTIRGKLYKPNQKNTPRYIILHSTISESPDYAVDRHRAHFVVDRKGKIYYVVDLRKSVDHVGDIDNRRAKALWNGEEYLSRKSIGIEVVASLKDPEWNEEQYKAVERLLHHYSWVFNIPVRNIVTHQQVACALSKSGRLYRGRKSDPFRVDWAKLDLPNNYRLLDKEVMSGRVDANLSKLKTGRGWAKKPEATIEGLRYSDANKTPPKVAARKPAVKQAPKSKQRSKGKPKPHSAPKSRGRRR